MGPWLLFRCKKYQRCSVNLLENLDIEYSSTIRKKSIQSTFDSIVIRGDTSEVRALIMDGAVALILQSSINLQISGSVSRIAVKAPAIGCHIGLIRIVTDIPYTHVYFFKHQLIL